MTCPICKWDHCEGFACARRQPEGPETEVRRYLDEQLRIATASDEWECGECGWTGEARDVEECVKCPECGEGWCCWPEYPRNPRAAGVAS